MKIINHLRERKLISDVINEKDLLQRLEKGKISLYCGFDPTSDSLHIGHLIPLMCLRRFQMCGHKPFVLIGGATGLVGDPSLRSKRRETNKEDVVDEWKSRIVRQIHGLLDFEDGEFRATILDNCDWLRKTSIIDFLHNFGRYFSVKQLMGRNLGKLSPGGRNLTLPEFVYPALQGYDFVHLNKNCGVELQIGGSDQYVNISSGINMIRRLHSSNAYGITLPIATRPNGSKFGKSDADNIWLDPEKTSPYNFYQFWLNVDDLLVQRFIRLFTFLDPKIPEDHPDGSTTYRSYMKEILAEEVTRIVHGAKRLRCAKRITAGFFRNKVNDLTEDDLVELSKAGMLIQSRPDENLTLKCVLKNSGLVSSNKQARWMIETGSITVNGRKALHDDLILGDEHRIHGFFTVVCRGKKNHRLIQWLK